MREAWPNHGAAANPAGASRLQSLPPVRRVAELGSLGPDQHATTHNRKQSHHEDSTPNNGE
jgi:hypothetical protein